MSGPPPPPKRKNRQPTGSFGGAGHNVARSLNSNGWKTISENDYHQQKVSKLCLMNDLPDSVIGEGVEIHGELQFDRLLRVDGKFQGKLISKGDLIVGHRGCIVGDITTITRMIVDGGSITGNIFVEELVLRGKSVVQGDISCKAIEIIGQDVSLLGRANVHPLAPELVDADDNIISAVPPKAKRTQKPFPPPIVPSPVVVRNIAQPNVSPPTLHGSRSPLPPVTIVPRTDVLTSEDPEAVSVETARLEHLATKSRRQEALQLSSQEGGARADDPSALVPQTELSESTPSMAPTVALAPADDMTKDTDRKPVGTAGASGNPQIFLPPSAEQRAAQLELDSVAGGPVSAVDAESAEREKSMSQTSIPLGSGDVAPETDNAIDSTTPEVHVAAPEATGNESTPSAGDNEEETVTPSGEEGSASAAVVEAETEGTAADESSPPVAAVAGPWGNDESVEPAVVGKSAVNGREEREDAVTKAAVTPHFVEPGEVQIAADSPSLRSLKDVAGDFTDLAESISSGVVASDGPTTTGDA